MRVDSRVSERLKIYHPRKWGNNSKVLKAHGIIVQRPAFPPKWTLAPEKQKPNPPPTRSAPPHMKIRDPLPLPPPAHNHRCHNAKNTWTTDQAHKHEKDP